VCGVVGVSGAVGGAERSPGVSERQRTNSAPADTEPETPNPESADREFPSVEERVDDVKEEFPRRAFQLVTEQHGKRLREEALEEPTTRERLHTPYCHKCGQEPCEEPDIHGNQAVPERVVDRRPAKTLEEVVREFLENYEDYRRKRLKMRKGKPQDPNPESFNIDLRTSEHPKYQEQEYAQARAFARELCGYRTCEKCEKRFCERPEKHMTEWVSGKFTDPYVVLPGFTTSGLDADGEPVPIADHMERIKTAWSGENGSDGVRRTLRYVMEEKLGLDSSDWEMWRQGEPHPGDGPNRGLHHDHAMVVFDAAEADGLERPPQAADFDPVVAKHIAECEGAEWDGHRDAVTVEPAGREAGGGQMVANYMAEYIQNDDADLLERPTKYLVWAATNWATNTRKVSRSDGANHAIAADACKQRARSPEADQEAGHGEQIRRADRKARHDFECAECGSPHGIDQDPETLVEARREGPVTADTPEAAARAVAGPEIVADGGELEEPVTEPVGGDPTDAERRLHGTVEERNPETGELEEVPVWQDATGGGVIASDGTVAKTSRPPPWKPYSLVFTDDREEKRIGKPDGVDMGRTVLPGKTGVCQAPNQREWCGGPNGEGRACHCCSALKDGPLPEVAGGEGVAGEPTHAAVRDAIMDAVPEGAGSGVERGTLVATVSDRIGADPERVEHRIDRLLSGGRLFRTDGGGLRVP
jgi:hypothetical protein